MKFFLLVFLLLLPFIRNIFPNGNQIRWTPNEKLKWSDFKKSIPETFKHKGVVDVAFINAGIKYTSKIKNDTTIMVDVYADFDKSLSSKSQDKKNLTEDKLQHEQDHFDIWEWYARIFRKRLIDSNLTKSIEVHAIYYKIFNEANAIEDKYDQETNHSIDTVAQHKWDILITQKLNQYSDYSTNEVIVHIRKQ